jgi:hypothetical protein
MNEQTYPLFHDSNPSQGLACLFVRKIQSIIFYFRYFTLFFGKFKPNPEKKMFLFPYTDIKRNLEAEPLSKQSKLFQTFWLSVQLKHELDRFSRLFDKIWQIFAFFRFWPAVSAAATSFRLGKVTERLKIGA